MSAQNHPRLTSIVNSSHLNFNETLEKHNHNDHHDHSLHPHQHDGAGDVIANSIFAMTGILIILFNLFMLSLYVRRRKVRQNVTYMMLQLFIYCLLDGFYFSMINTLHRKYKYVVPNWFCIVANLMRAFFSLYLMLLLPLIVVERFILVKNPHFTSKNSQKFTIISSTIALLVTFLSGWLPMIPELDIASNYDDYKHTTYSLEQTCEGLLNRYNVVQPVLVIVFSALCVMIVAGLYMRMFCIFRERLGSFANLTDRRRIRIKRATISVLIISLTFALTTIPTGISTQYTTLCKSIHDENFGVCKDAGFTIWILTDTLFHMGHLLAPLLFSMYNPKIRCVMVDSVRCWKKQTTQSSTSHSQSLSRSKHSSSLANKQGQIIPSEDHNNCSNV